MVGVPVLGVVSDGQASMRLAVAEALPGVPHQLCHFHFLREAAHRVSEADRHAKKEMKGTHPVSTAGTVGPPSTPVRVSGLQSVP